jgi:hypothetical protein
MLLALSIHRSTGRARSSFQLHVYAAASGISPASPSGGELDGDPEERLLGLHGGVDPRDGVKRTAAAKAGRSRRRAFEWGATRRTWPSAADLLWATV